MNGASIRIRGRILLTTFIACTLAYSFHFTSFLHPKLAVLCAGAVVLAVVTALHEGGTLRGFRVLAPLWIFILLVVARLTVAPVRVPGDAFIGIVYGALLLLVVNLSIDLLQCDEWFEVFVKTLAILSFVLAVLGLLQYAGVLPFLFPEFPAYGQHMYGVFGNQDLTGGFIALGLPLLFRWAILETERVRLRAALGGAFLAALCGLILSESRAGWLAGSVGVLIAWCTLRAKLPFARWLMAGTGALVVLLVIFFPQSTVERFPQAIGIQARLSMWRAALDMAREHPMAGVGFGQYAYWSPRYIGRQPVDRSRPAASRERHADQPHSEPLRILAETGILGVLCWVWMAILWLLRARGTVARVAAGPLAAFTVFSMFNGTFESPPHALVAVLLFAAPISKGPSSRFAPSLVPMPAVLLALFLGWSVIVPSVMLRKAQDVQMADSKTSLSYFARAVWWPYATAAVHRDYAIAFTEAGYPSAARGEFLRALEGLDTGDIYLGLAIVSCELDDRDSARRYAEECLLRWPDCPEATAIAGKSVTP